MITGAQIRMARGYLKWSVKDLAARSSVAESTVRRMEETDDVPNARALSLEAVEKALRDAGVEFISENGGGPGVRLRKR